MTKAVVPKAFMLIELIGHSCFPLVDLGNDNVAQEGNIVMPKPTFQLASKCELSASSCASR